MDAIWMKTKDSQIEQHITGMAELEKSSVKYFLETGKIKYYDYVDKN